MRVKWSRNLDVPAQQRGGQTSARESSKDDRRKSFLNIFKFRDRKNEDDRRKASESEIYPPREVIDGKIRKTVTFADQQSSGTSVVCNRKGRRVSADAVDMTVFKVSKSDSLSKPQSSCTAVERSPLFKRTEDDGTLLPERKQSERSETGGKSKSEKPTSSDAAPVSRESEVRSLSSRNKTDLSRTLGKSGTCTDEEQKNGSKIPILVSKESFSVAKDAFKSDFWSNNIEISAKSQRQFSSSKLGLESDRINSYGVRKNTLQPANKREEEKTVEEMLRSKVPVSDSVSCKDSKIKAVSEKSHHQICLGEAVIPRNLSRENNKQAPIKTPSYSPVGYCGISKLVLPKVVVNDKVASTYGVSNNYRKDFSLQGIGTPRFESKKESSCHNKPPLLKNDPPADQENVKPKEELSTQEKMSENKSDCPTQEGRPASNEVVESDDIVSAPPVERKSGEVTSPPKLPADKTGDALIEATTGENTCPEKPLLNVDPSENEASTCSATELNAADKSAADLHAAQVEKNLAAADGGVVIENNDNEIPLKQNNSLSPLCLQPNDSLRCLNEIVLTKEVKDQIILASNAPIPVKSGIENMRNLLDASVIIVNHRELSTKPWICNIFTPREPKRSCFENRLICDKGSPSSRTETGRTNEISSASCKDEVREIVLIQNNISVEPKKAIEMPSCGHSLPTGSDHTQDVITEQEVVSGFSKEVEQQDTICRLIEDDNVAFIDEHIDTPEEIASDNDKEAKSDISLAPALNTAIASINKIEPDVISETAFECRVSKSGKCWQQSVPEICSAGHMADDNEKFEGSSSDDPVCIPQGSDVEAGNLLASCSDAGKRDVLAYRDTRDERKIEKSPSEKDRADSEILHFRPSLPFESATEGSASVKLEDGEIPHTSNASEVNCDAIPLKKYDSIEFIDDITDEESNSGRSSDVVSPSMSSSADGQEDASTKEKEVQLHTSQSGDVFKTEPKTSQSPGVGKYGGSTQTQGPPAWSTRVELQQEIQRLGTLCEARTKELNHMKMNFRHASLGFDAFVVLFQYLTDELDAFSQPRLVLELEKTHTALEEAEAHLHQYQKEFEEMKAKHSEELCKLEKELNQSHQETIENLNLNHNAEIEELRQCHDKQLAELAETHMKQCQEMEEKHSTALLELKNEHSLQIEELKIFHADQIEAIENSHHETRMELNNQLKELEQQCKDLKHQAKLVEEALQRDTDTKIQWISAKKADLEKEVDSLKTVLDMRRTEIHSLRKENLEMKKELEKLPIAKEKIKMLEAKAEDLQALVNEKIQIERQLSTDHQNLKESYEKESKVNTRLSMENEELMWKLKQNYEANLLLSSFTGGTDTAEKSPLKSPARQSVSLPMFFHSMETTAPESDKMSLPMSSSNVTPCKKLPPLARKCSSPVRTPSFVGASPPGPCSRKCKLDLKAVISPRKQKHKLHHSEKKFPSKETDSTSGHHPSETELLQHSRLQYDESCHCAKDSSPSSVNGTSSDGSQPDCLGEMDHNGVLFDDPLNRSNGSSNEEMYSAEAEYLDESLNFEHYDMLITNQILSKKYKELTHLKKGTEITHEFDDSQHDSFFSYSNSDNHSIANSQNVTAAEEIASSKEFTFNEQHFADIQPQEYHLSFPCHSGQSFHKKSDSWTVSSFCGHTGEPAASTLSHSGCDNSLQSHLQPENSSVTTETHSQITQPSTSQNCSHPLQSTYSQEK